MGALSETLRAARESHNFSVPDVAKLTNIRGKIIAAIENDELDMLPAPYMKSFVRSYATFLKFSTEETNELVNNAFASRPTQAVMLNGHSHNGSLNGKSKTAVFGKTDLHSAFNTPANSIITKLIYSGLFIALVALAYYFGFRSPDEQTGLALNSLSASVIEPLDIRSASTPAVSSEAATGTPAIQDSLVLSAIATEQVWLSIVIDGQKSLQTLMQPGDTRLWKADKNFKLTLGNAGGVKFVFNGENVDPLGPSGTVITELRMNRDGIFSSNRRKPSPPSKNIQESRPSGDPAGDAHANNS